MSHPTKIVIAQRGWVFVGQVEEASPTQLVIHGAKNIRRWGTSNGLGEIAMHGPTDRTELDHAGTVRIHPLAVVATLDCDASKWTA